MFLGKIRTEGLLAQLTADNFMFPTCICNRRCCLDCKYYNRQTLSAPLFAHSRQNLFNSGGSIDAIVRVMNSEIELELVSRL